MADLFGALALPAPVADDDSGDGTETNAAGDPALDVLLDYFKAVLIADAGDMWNERAPSTNEQPIVRAVFAHDPTQCEFLESHTPSLYLWRRGEGAGFDVLTEDLLRESAALALWWVFPTTPNPNHQRDRLPIVNAIGKSIARACRNARHPAWVRAEDSTADPDAIRLATTNTTGAVTWSGASLNGATGDDTVNAPRAVTVTSSASVGAFNTTDPTEVTGLLGVGNGSVEHTESIYLTAANGGQTITGIWKFASVSSVTRPAQTLAAGTLSVGYAASPEAPGGSLVKRYAGLMSLRMTSPAKLKTFMLADGDRDPIGPFYYVEMAIAIEELEAEDLDAGVAAGKYEDLTAGTYGAQITVVNAEGETMSVGDLPNE